MVNFRLITSLWKNPQNCCVSETNGINVGMKGQETYSRQSGQWLGIYTRERKGPVGYLSLSTDGTGLHKLPDVPGHPRPPQVFLDTSGWDRIEAGVDMVFSDRKAAAAASLDQAKGTEVGREAGERSGYLTASPGEMPVKVGESTDILPPPGSALGWVEAGPSPWCIPWKWTDEAWNVRFSALTNRQFSHNRL